MTRDEARRLWIDAQLDNSHLNLGRLQKLRQMVNDEMKASGLIRGSFRVQGQFRAGIGSRGWWAALACKSCHFEKREAITFEDSGFVAFAGWADDTNVQPIITAFAKWVEWMKRECFYHGDM